MCADACQAAGLNVVELGEKLKQRLDGALSASATLQNPIDITATATARDFGFAIETLADADACDAIITLFVPPLMTDPVDVASAVDAVLVAAGIPVASVFMTRELPRAGSVGVSAPRFALPEEAVRALAHAVDYAAWRSRPVGVTVDPSGVRSDEARVITAAALARGAGWLGPREVARLFACYGLPLISTELVATPAKAVAAARSDWQPGGDQGSRGRARSQDRRWRRQAGTSRRRRGARGSERDPRCGQNRGT